MNCCSPYCGHCTCVYVSACMHACVCSCVCSEHAPDRGLTLGQVSSSITSSYLFVVFLRKSLPLVLVIHWIANKPRDSPLCLPSRGLQAYPATTSFMRLLQMGSQVLVCARQELYCPSLIPVQHFVLTFYMALNIEGGKSFLSVLFGYKLY